MAKEIRPKCISHHERYNGPIHEWFSLSYASYYTVPRLALQGMPLWWQKIFLWLVNMLPETPEYACQRRDGAGRFIKDPWANYRRGNIAEIIAAEEAERDGWKILAVEDRVNVERPNE